MPTNPPTMRETLALGWLCRELSNRAGAWSGDAPEWFPAPYEFLALWQEALDTTAVTCERISSALPADASSGHRYPYEDGDTTVLGPGVFASRDGNVICWRGEHYALIPGGRDPAGGDDGPGMAT